MAVKLANSAGNEHWPLYAAAALTLPVAILAHRLLVLLPPLCVLTLLGVAFAKGWRPTARAWPGRWALATMLPFLIVLAWACVTVAWSIAPEDSITRLVRLGGSLISAICSFAAVRLVAARDFAAGWQRPGKNAVFLLAGGVALAALLIFFYLALGDGLIGAGPDGWDRGRGREFFNPAASVAAVLAFPLIVSLWRGVGARLAVPVAIGLICAIFLSEARAAQLGLIAALFGFGLVWLGGRRAISAIAYLAALMVVILPALGLIVDRPVSSAGQLVENAGIGVAESARHRMRIYDFTLERIAERPLFGWGMGTSRALPGGKAKIDGDRLELLPLHPHNGALEIWVELGVIGAGCLALILLRLFWALRALAADRRLAGVWVGATFAYMTLGLLSFSIWSGWWVAVGIMAASLAVFQLHIGQLRAGAVRGAEG